MCHSKKNRPVCWLAKVRRCKCRVTVARDGTSIRLELILSAVEQATGTNQAVKRRARLLLRGGHEATPREVLRGRERRDGSSVMSKRPEPRLAWTYLRRETAALTAAGIQRLPSPAPFVAQSPRLWCRLRPGRRRSAMSRCTAKYSWPGNRPVDAARPACGRPRVWKRP